MRVTSPIARLGRGSLFTIVPAPWLSVIVALTAPDRLTTYVSFASFSRSPITGTVIGWVVVPGVNVSVPLVGV